jgi:3-methylfumaryl-CoA hydratase
VSTAYDEWVGRVDERVERIGTPAAQAMAATLDLDRAPGAGDALPPGWQWLYFNPPTRRSGLGEDGHPKRGGFLPPIDLPRRMWAGSRIRYVADLPVDVEATRRSRIAKVENKVGKRGSLWFVTVAHEISVGGQVCIEEEQDIVYRDASPPGAAPAAPPAHDAQGEWGRAVAPDPTLLFRYSALTFNGHRIHYDQAYARDVEGYPDLVVHGPLTATLLQQAAVEEGGGRRLATFDFRGVSPLFVSRPFRLEGRPDANGSLALWARGPDGELAMSATATFR